MTGTWKSSTALDSPSVMLSSLTACSSKAETYPLSSSLGVSMQEDLGSVLWHGERRCGFWVGTEL